MRGKILWTALLTTLVAGPVSTPSAMAASCDPSNNLFGNPGFETGSLPPGVVLGTNPSPTVSSAQAHSGTDSVLIGNVNAFSETEPLGDGSLYQQVTVPADTSELSFWYWPATTDSITFDWQDAYVTNTSGTILATVFHQTSNAQTWIHQTFDMTPYIGQTVRIEFLVHEDGFGDDTGMFVDDVCLSGPPPLPPPPVGSTLFAPDSPWNRKLEPNDPLDPASAQLAATLTNTIAARGAWVQSDSYSTPLWTVPADQPKVKVVLDSWRKDTPMQQLFNLGVPIPPEAKQAAGSDGHMTIWQPDTDKLWEFWGATQDSNGVWHAQTGGAFEHVSQSPGYYSAESWPPYSDSTWTATATGLPVVAGTTLASEFRAGVIPHALAIDLPDARGAVWAWPAQQSDGSGGADLLPEGAHIRLPADVDLSGLSGPAKIIAVALRDYGGIIRDRTGGAVGIYFEDRVAHGEADPFYDAGGMFGGQWPNTFLSPANFPWSKIQVLKMKLCSTYGSPCTPP